MVVWSPLWKRGGKQCECLRTGSWSPVMQDKEYGTKITNWGSNSFDFYMLMFAGDQQNFNMNVVTWRLANRDSQSYRGGDLKGAMLHISIWSHMLFVSISCIFLLGKKILSQCLEKSSSYSHAHNWHTTEFKFASPRLEICRKWHKFLPFILGKGKNETGKSSTRKIEVLMMPIFPLVKFMVWITLCYFIFSAKF